MSTLVYMKLLEKTPARYDRGMRFLTLGRIDRIKRESPPRGWSPARRFWRSVAGPGNSPP